MTQPNIVFYRAAGGVVVDEAGEQLLLLIRPAQDEVRLPKGHVEEGETSREAALRETAEETGYADLEIVEGLGAQLVAFVVEDRQVRRVERYYLMRLGSQARSKRPAADAEQFVTVWAPWDEALEHLTFEAEREWVRRGRRRLQADRETDREAAW
jgi:ADP-ribose pyrophosphatase YjhB (NUDIX family)